MGRTSSVVVALVMVAVCAAAAGTVDATLRVYNGIEDGASITVTTLGCCGDCAPNMQCVAYCRPCSSVVIQSRTIGTWPSGTGPYSFRTLFVQVHGRNTSYSVSQFDAQYLTYTALLRVGPGHCGTTSPFGIQGLVVDGSNQFFDICLQSASRAP